jgi:branched-chain amino acid transport system substrate-binding protein
MLILFTANAYAADPGVTDTEIVIGGHTTESGTWAMFNAHPKAITAYLDVINAKGGIDGRKIKYIRIDTQNDYAKGVQAAKKLVEQDKIFAFMSGSGTSHQAVYKYLIENKIPDMWIFDLASMYTIPPNKYSFPIAFSYLTEGKTYGEYITKHLKGKKPAF